MQVPRAKKNNKYKATYTRALVERLLNWPAF